MHAIYTRESKWPRAKLRAVMSFFIEGVKRKETEPNTEKFKVHLFVGPKGVGCAEVPDCDERGERKKDPNYVELLRLIEKGYFCTREVTVEATERVRETRNSSTTVQTQAAKTSFEPVIDKNYLLGSLADSDILAIAKIETRADVILNTYPAFLSAYKKTDVKGQVGVSMHIDIVCKNTTIAFSGAVKKLIEAILPLCLHNNYAWLELRAISPGLVHFYQNLGFETVQNKQDSKYEGLRGKFQTDEDFYLKHGTLMHKAIRN